MCKQNPENSSNSHSKTSITDNDVTLKENIDELENNDIIESEEQDSKSKSNQLKLENIKGILDEKSIKIEKLESDFKCLKDTVGKLSDHNRAWFAIKIATVIGTFAILIGSTIGLFTLFFSFHSRVDQIYQYFLLEQSNQYNVDSENVETKTNETTKIQSQNENP